MFGITVSEEHGGSGLGAAEEALIVIGLGRRLAAPAVLATIGATHAQRSGGAADLAGGESRLPIDAANASSSSRTPRPISCSCAIVTALRSTS